MSQSKWTPEVLSALEPLDEVEMAWWEEFLHPNGDYIGRAHQMMFLAFAELRRLKAELLEVTEERDALRALKIDEAITGSYTRCKSKEDIQAWFSSKFGHEEEDYDFDPDD